MTGKTHVGCSVAAMSVYAIGHASRVAFMGAYVFPWLGVVASAVGALLPDIDIAQSRLGQRFKFLSKNLKHRGITHTLVGPVVLAVCLTQMKTRLASVVVSLIVGAFLSMMYDSKVSLSRGGFMTKVKSMAKHKRGLLTTIVLVVMSCIVPETGASLVWGLLCGWTLHIIEDLFNKPGCPILYPVSKGRISFGRVKTRHWSEGVFFALWIGGCLLWVLRILAGR